MASEAEVRYHRSFLSPKYWENFYRPDMWEKAKRTADEIEAIRLKDPKAFENTRKALAVLLKEQYIAGGYVARSNQSGNASGWVSGQPSDFKVAEVLKPKNPPQAAVKHPTTGAIAMPNVPFGVTAAHVHDQVLHPVQMYHKLDQRFEEYATPWELVWSNLSYPYDRGFTPIIDDSYKVIGHFGSVVGGPKGGSFHERSLILSRDANVSSLEVASAKGVAVLVHSATGLPPGYKNGNFESTERKIEVRTGLDGEVTSFRYVLQGALVQPWYSPIDIIVAPKIMVNLAKIGMNVATSLMQKRTAKLASRAALNGPTESLAKDGTMMAGKTLPGMAVSTGAFKLPVEHSARRTIIMGDDLPKFRQFFAQSKPVEGFYDVFIHGNANSFQIMVKVGGKEVWKDVSVREVANAVKPHLKPGDKIRLISCEAGCTVGAVPAQKFANELNHTVWAPTTKVDAVPAKWAPSTNNPAAPTSTFVPSDGGKFKEFVPLRTNVHVVKRAIVKT